MLFFSPWCSNHDYESDFMEGDIPESKERCNQMNFLICIILLSDFSKGFSWLLIEEVLQVYDIVVKYGVVNKVSFTEKPCT